MNQTLNPKSVHAPVGVYSHSVSVPAGARWIAVAGQVGMNKNGRLAAGIRRQAEQAFRNVLACLRENGLRKQDLVKLTVFLTDARHIAEYRAARARVLGDALRPASTLLIVAGLASPDMLIEVEAWAARS
ncbi:MAG TPA: RidA family protein [Burkholderiales bacterium]|nr:RidA family protein [Burkholderiales bacterium]